MDVSYEYFLTILNLKHLKMRTKNHYRNQNDPIKKIFV